jgi:hypothetical protein
MTSVLDREISALFDLCIKINELKQSRNLGLSGKKVNPTIVSLNKYMKVFERTDAEEHRPYINTVYNKFRKEILKNESDKWIKNNQVYIQYGDNLSNTADFEKVKAIRVYISIFYFDAIKIKDEVETELEGLPANTHSSRNELLYPEFFTLHLYRIFRQCCDNKQERETLAKHVKSIESDLGISHDEQPDQTPSGTLGGGDGFGNILGALTKTLGNMKLPDMAMPSQGQQGSQSAGSGVPDNINTDDIGKMVNQVLSNPKVGQTINTIVSDFQNCNSMEQMLAKLMSKMNDPSLTEAISSTFAATASAATQPSLNDRKED